MHTHISVHTHSGIPTDLVSDHLLNEAEQDLVGRLGFPSAWMVVHSTQLLHLCGQQTGALGQGRVVVATITLATRFSNTGEEGTGLLFSGKGSTRRGRWGRNGGRGAKREVEEEWWERCKEGGGGGMVGEVQRGREETSKGEGFEGVAVSLRLLIAVNVTQ